MRTHKSHKLSLVSVVLLSLYLASACVTHQRVATEAELGGHRVSVRPQCDSASTDSRRQYEADGTSSILFYEFTCGDTKVVIRGSLLTVNDKSYGTINDYDQIAIDYGKVRVNSKVREELH